MSCSPASLPLLVFWDFAAAFPSVIHRWIFTCLFVCNFPDSYIDFVKAIYHLNSTDLCVDGSPTFFCWVLSGVLQGCPLSGTLFAIAIDPILRLLERQLDGGRLGILRACADDIGAALSSATALCSLEPVFSLARVCAGLCLKAKKCVIIRTYCRCTMSTIEVWMTLLSKHVPTWSRFRVAGAAKYLAVVLGPEAGQVLRQEQVAKWRVCPHRHIPVPRHHRLVLLRSVLPSTSRRH